MKKINNLNSHNTIEYYEYYDTDKEFSIVMELCDDNLSNILQQKTTYEVEKIYKIIQQINNLFLSIKDNKIMYENIKLENILVNYVNYEGRKELNIKLSDYGKSKIILNLNRQFNMPITMAPELINNCIDNKESNKSNLWSLGIIIYRLSIGKYPYDANNKKEFLEKIKKDGQKNFKKSFDSILDDLISKLLVDELSKRLNWKDYFNHPFCNKNLFILNEKCYKGNYVLKGDEKEINFYKFKLGTLEHFKDINFANLEFLYLSKNSIENIACVKKFICPKLKALDLSFNCIEDISSILYWKFKHLKLLNLIHNEIVDIDVFDNIQIYNNLNLKSLLLSNNKIYINSEDDDDENKKIIKKIKSKNIYIDIDILFE